MAQVAQAPGLLAEQINLAPAVLPWSGPLRNGQAFTERFRTAAGGDHSERAGAGIFWSTDPQRPVGARLRELGSPEIPVVIAEPEAARLCATKKR